MPTSDLARAQKNHRLALCSPHACLIKMGFCLFYRLQSHWKTTGMLFLANNHLAFFKNSGFSKNLQSFDMILQQSVSILLIRVAVPLNKTNVADIRHKMEKGNHFDT